mgnify:CR=1 FL=1
MSKRNSHGQGTQMGFENKIVEMMEQRREAEERRHTDKMNMFGALLELLKK